MIKFRFTVEGPELFCVLGNYKILITPNSAKDFHYMV